MGKYIKFKRCKIFIEEFLVPLADVVVYVMLMLHY